MSASDFVNFIKSRTILKGDTTMKNYGCVYKLELSKSKVGHIGHMNFICLMMIAHTGFFQKVGTPSQIVTNTSMNLENFYYLVYIHVKQSCYALITDMVTLVFYIPFLRTFLFFVVHMAWKAAHLAVPSIFHFYSNITTTHWQTARKQGWAVSVSTTSWSSFYFLVCHSVSLDRLSFPFVISAHLSMSASQNFVSLELNCS